MNYGKLDMYESFVIEEDELEPSILYNLEPITTNGKDVESLSSYLIRLSNTNCTTLLKMTSQTVMPLLRSITLNSIKTFLGKYPTI